MTNPFTTTAFRQSVASPRSEGLARLRKSATVGGDNETEFEQAFASLAYTYVKDKAPKLLDHLVGFQLVERSNDNEKAAGIFGFRAGKSWYQVPVLFMNGDVKGHELLYVKDKDMVVPLKEKWVNHLLRDNGVSDGRAAHGSAFSLGVRQPDIRALSSPPNSKRGSAPCQVWPNASLAGWLPSSAGMQRVFAAATLPTLQDAAYSLLGKTAGCAPGDILEDLLKQSPVLCKAAVDLFDAYPSLGESFERFHGETFLLDALRQHRRQIKQAASLSDQIAQTVVEYHFGGGAKSRKRKRKLTDPVEWPEDPNSSPLKSKEKSAAHRVRIVVQEMTLTDDPEALGLSEQDSETLASRGYVVRDSRSDAEISKAYSAAAPNTLSTPGETGIYEVLTRSDKLSPCLVVCGQGGLDGSSIGSRASTAVELETGEWVNADNSTLWGRPDPLGREAFKAWYDEAEDATPEVGGVFLLISDTGSSIFPFHVDEKLEQDGQYIVRLIQNTDFHRRRSLLDGSRNADMRRYHEPSCGGDSFILYLKAPTGSHSVRVQQKCIYAPAKYKCIRLKAPEHAYSAGSGGFDPGDLSELHLRMTEKTAALRIHVDRDDAAINGEPLQSKRACLFSLIRDHGLRHDEAREIMAQAERTCRSGKRASFRIAYAPGYQKLAFPAVDTGDYAISRDFGGYLSQEPYESEQAVEEMSPRFYEEREDDPEEERIAQTAHRAGQMGQKEVFDASMLTRLVRSVRQDSEISRIVPTLLKSVDRLGRLLLLFYWHNADFADRYGKSDMPELEDTLRNSFEQLGDLVLFLKEKDVSPLLQGGLEDIDVEEAANT